jgi:voltage-gated potassium channel
MSAHTNLQRWERHAEWPLAAAALLFLVLYSVQVLARPHRHEAHVLWASTWIIWGLFILDYVARLCLASDRSRWFFRHLLDLAIVALPLVRPLRLLRLIVLVEVLQRAVGDAFRGRIVVDTVSGVLPSALASWIIQRVAEEETASQTATAAHIDELRSDIRELTEQLRARG